MAKITKATKGGRTIYKIAGTSKYALTLAKAKEIAAKVSGGKRTSSPARRAAKKPLTARGVSRLGAKQVVALAVPRPTRARLMDFYRDIKEMGAEALAERGISPATDAFALKVRSALEDAMDAERTVRVSRTVARVEKELKTPAGRAKYRRLEKAATSTRGLKSATRKKSLGSNRPARRTASLKTALRTFYLNAPGGGMMYTPAGVAAAKRLLAAFKADPRGVAADAGIPARSVSAAFIKAVKADIEYFVADYAHLRKEDRAYARQKRASGERNEPSILGTKRQPKKRASTGKPTSRRKPKTRTPKLIGRAYTNRYGERVGPTRILGRTVDYAMKIVRTKGRGLKATPEHRKEIVSKYRKALQKAGFLRGAATRSNSRGADSGPLPKGYFEVVPAASKAQKRRHEELGHRILLKVTLTGMGVESNVRPPLPNTVAHLRETYHFTQKDAEAVVRAAADAPTGEWIEARGPSRPRGGPLVREMRPQV